MKKIKMLVSLGTPQKSYGAGKWYDVDDDFADSLIRAKHAVEIKPTKAIADKITSTVKADKKQSADKADKTTSEKL